MEKYDVKVRYIFEGTYTVVAEDREEAESMVAEDCGLVLGGNIHTTRDDDEVTDWKFGCHPDLQVLSVRQRGGKSPMSVFGEDYDPVWVIWFGKNGDPYECRVTGLRVTDSSLTVLAEEKESGDEVECYSPFELGASNIDWLSGMYEAVWQQLEESKKVEPQTEEQ